MSAVTLRYKGIRKLTRKTKTLTIYGRTLDSTPYENEFICIALDAATDDPKARQALEEEGISDCYPEPVEEIKFGDYIDFDPEIESDLMKILLDDEAEYQYIKNLIAKTAYFWHYIRPTDTKSRHKRDKALEIARDVKELIVKIHKNFNTVERQEFNQPKEMVELNDSYEIIELRKIEEVYRSIANQYDPKGKRSESDSKRRFIAHALCSGIKDGSLCIPLSTNNKSDLSRLFRLCCSILDLPEPKNAYYYLSQYE